MCSQLLDKGELVDHPIFYLPGLGPFFGSCVELGFAEQLLVLDV